MRKPYIIYKRGAYPRRISAEALQLQLGDAAAGISITSKTGVDALARLATTNGTAITQAPKSAIGAGEYLLNFWNVDGDYALKMARSKRALSKAYLHVTKRGINKHVIPWLTKMGYNTYPVQRITTAIQEDMLTEFLENGVAANRCNAIRTSLSKPFEELRWRGVIQVNPVTNTVRFRPDTAKPKILTLAEAKDFFAADSQDERARIACLLSMTTGLRISEVCGTPGRIVTDPTHRRPIAVEMFPCLRK